MPRKQKKYHFTYKTINTKTGRYYYGMHSTDKLDDGYLGSGKRLRYSIRKYGKDCHVREILEFFEDRERMLDAERKLITDAEVLNRDCLNVKIGGEGGWDHINGSTEYTRFSGMVHTEETINKIRKSATGRVLDDKTRRKISENHWSKRDPEAHKRACGSTLGTNLSESHKNKIRNSLIGIKQTIVKCPHCNKSGGERAMGRYHFDNCKTRV